MTKCIIVTGASSGLGNFFCKQLAEDGFDVIGLSRTAPEKPNFTYIPCDVSNFDDVKKAFRIIKKDFHPTVLINAAGIASMNLFITTPHTKMQQIINTNVLGTMYCCQQALKLFIRTKDLTSIVNFSTIAVNIALKGESVYIASKAAIEAFSRTLAKEAGDFNCNVNTIAPGPVDTNLIKGLSEKQIKDIIDRQSICEKATTQEILKICKILFSEDAKDITGQVINVKGV